MTCAKHHFTWMLNQVFSLDITTPRGPANNFAFLEEDYLLGPSIYEAILAGLKVVGEADKIVPGGVMGLELDPTFAGNRKEQVSLGDKWYSMPWVSVKKFVLLCFVLLPPSDSHLDQTQT